MKRSPIKRRRSKPRRGRVVDTARLAWMATQPCLISGEMDATTHHVREYGSPKDDTRTIRLAWRYHLHGFSGKPNLSIEHLGKKKFEAAHGIVIEDEIAKYNRRYEQEMNVSLVSDSK